MFLDEFKKSDAVLTAASKGIEDFKDSCFSCTIHWGLYSLLSKGEWAMFTERMEFKDYESTMERFNPINFNADEWARTMCDAGIRQLFITSKHHDGFSMYDTKLSQYKITNTNFKRDPIAELALACHKYGISFHLYYSLMDWHHPAFLLDWSKYVEYYHGQIRELCTNYGEIGGILLDGFWPELPCCINDMEYSHFNPRGDYEFGKLYDMIHMLQPNAVITNNAHIPPLSGEDYQIFELDNPGENTAGFNTTYVSELPLASWYPMNNSWSYNKSDKNFKSSGYLIRKLLKFTGMGVNLFLNASPNELGEIVPEEKQLFHELGKWIKVNGEAIYGTRPIAGGEFEWGYVVKKDKTYYIYILCFPFRTAGDTLEIDILPQTLTSAITMDGEKLDLSIEGKTVKIKLPHRAHNPIGTIIKLL